ncbi:hypothetical protein CNO14_06245 (plasmid) [Borrelia miyamotoi]|uniref:Type ISP restriction-modification enzyme LLaBIII C-terminal specificity domain-containing protein n=2 Tax=Borrelia miyamotoi TaxID=47466 RepID=A0AAQ3HFH0_9SPIR|nr:hypothetical protein [Borrelia miyamotoi]AHH05925.1 Adenine-specific methyltransferase [Borrelia miyamotoi FR64b]ATQ15556.1 hypothetical protein CNO14_06245 [Borrelia miyamotoi]ATQ16689.1 hypothetical protein CNO13_05940 [Borrelia miyamotoi]ATQ17939.1 hypothetical protein CNO12_06560 [Borrelia miyamotoi]ATQ19197.1 hypothetical protein CNO11_06590 [Borrelia miyamotoi]
MEVVNGSTILKATNINAKYVKKIIYRPFDYRFIYYTKNKGVTSYLSYLRYDITRHFLEIKDNVGLVIIKFLAMDSLNMFLLIIKFRK